jgi:hypothetical protein
MSVLPIRLFWVSSIAALTMGWLVVNASSPPEQISEVRQSQIVGGAYCAIGGTASPTCMPGMCNPGTLTTGGPQVCLYTMGLGGCLNPCLGGACMPLKYSTCTVVPNCGGGSAIPPTAAPGAVGGANSMCAPTSTSADGLQIYTCGGPGACVGGGNTVCQSCI